jgi:hypothetical protein
MKEPISKYSNKDNIIDLLLEHNKMMATTMANVSNALEKINDTNLLHADAISENTKAITAMVNTNNGFLKIFRYVFILIIMALVVLAGAQEALKFLPPLR